MNGSDWGPSKLPLGWIAFAILFVVISSILCAFAHVSVLVYFPLLFLSGLISLVISNTLLNRFERTIVRLVGRYSERRTRGWGKNKAFWHW
jgi:hypothetical protein